MRALRPVARTQGLTTEETEGELLLSNEQGEPLLRLNRPAALVWKNSDGTRTVKALVAVLAEESELADEDQVLIALDELAKQGMIESGYTQRDANAARLSRRHFIRRAGLAAAAVVVVPVVHRLVVPETAAAVTVTYKYRYRPGAPGGTSGGGTGGGAGGAGGATSGAPGTTASDRDIKDDVVAVRWE